MFAKGNQDWKSRKVNKGGRPRKRRDEDAAVETSSETVGDAVVETVQASPGVDGVLDRVSADGVGVVDDDVTARELAVVCDVVVPEVEDESGFEQMKAIAHVKKRTFLKCYAELGNVIGAAEAAETSPRTHYYWVARDEDYREAFQTAKNIYSKKLLAEVHRRATMTEKPSDILLMFATKGLRNEYRDSVPAQSLNLLGPSSLTIFYPKGKD